MKKKYLITIIAVFAILIVLSDVSLADTSEHNHQHKIENKVASIDENKLFNEIMYTPCPGGGKHTMTEHGAGELYKDGKEIIGFGVAHQCSKCLKVIVSDYDPERHGKLGNYGVEQVTWRLLTSYTMKKPYFVGYNSSTSPTRAPWDSYVWY